MVDTFEDLRARLRAATARRERENLAAGRPINWRPRPVRNECSWREDPTLTDDWSQGNGEFQL